MSDRLYPERSEGLTARAAAEAPLRSFPYLPFAVGLVTLAAFTPALRNGFVDWDDGYLLVINPNWRGLGWSQIRWMFRTPLLENYVPIAWLTLGLDYVLWDMRPVGYHLTNLMLHTVSAILAMGSKVLVVIPPIVLILLDLYPLRRLPPNPRQWFDRSRRGLWLEKRPCFALGLAGAATAYFIAMRTVP